MKFPSKKQITVILSAAKQKPSAFYKTNRRLIQIFVKWLGVFVLLIGIVTTLDNIQKNKNKIWIIELLSTELPLFNNIEALAIIAGLIALALDTPHQQKKSHYEAWQVISLAENKSGNCGRIQALQDLAEDGVSLAGINLKNAYLVGINLPKSNLTFANFQNSRLNESNFSRAHLSEADLSGAHLESANLSHAKFGGANLSYTNLRNTDLTNTDLGGVILDGAYLERANLSYASLQGIPINDVIFQNANLSNADLSCTNFTSANLGGANLSNANLSYANLSGANLGGVILSNADLTDAIFWDKESGKEAKYIALRKIKQAKNWEKAIYSPKFREELGLPPEEETDA